VFKMFLGQEILKMANDVSFTAETAKRKVDKKAGENRV